MRATFVKMHGAGNDFVVIDERAAAVPIGPDRVAALADRRRGIGFDQLVRLLPPSREASATVRMRIQNPDGSESDACGNATRCVAALLTGFAPGTASIETAAARLECRVLGPDSVEVDMGRPGLDPAALGIADGGIDTLHLPLAGDPAGCSMGNPHATLFVADPDAVDAAARGRALECHPLFGARANIGFAAVRGTDEIRLRVWERGAGLTLACGTGACAALVNAHRRGLCGRRARVVQDGGTLEIAWGEDGRVSMTGPVALAFRGEFEA